jgi:hypothetical protein
MKVLKDLAVSGSITVGQFLQSSINTDKFLVSESGVVKYRSGSQILGDIGAAASGHTHTFASLTSKPTTLSGYGITDAALSATTITINGTTYDLSANRSWTISGTDATKLPLSGGTLTGALNGTSASFSGKIAFSANSGATAQGQIGRDATYGLFNWASTGATDDYAIFSASGTYIMHTPTGTANTVLGGALNGTSAVFSGDVTINSRILLTTNVIPTDQGQIAYNASVGLYIWSKAGSAYDFTLYNKDGNEVIQVPTGTRNILFGGAATFSSTIKTAGFGSTTARTWKLGECVTATVIGVNTTGYITIEVNGSQYNLAIANLS